MGFSGCKLYPKSYNDSRVTSAHAIPDRDVYVAVAPHYWKRPVPFGIQLFSGGKVAYRVTVSPGPSLGARAITFGLNPPETEVSVHHNIISPYDDNTVVRIMKTTRKFETYVNGHHIEPTGACNISQTNNNSGKIANATFNVWDLKKSRAQSLRLYSIISCAPGLMHRVEALENHMMDPATSFWKSISNSHPKGTLIPKEVQAVINEMENILEMREGSRLEEDENHAGTGTGTGGDGSDNRSGGSTSTDTTTGTHSNSSQGLDVNPPDAEIITLCATVAWPRAVKQILGASLFDPIKTKHQHLMSSWAASRGDGISSQAYDYLTYSLGVGWPRAIVEATSEDDFIRVRRRYEEIVKVLA